MNAAADIRPVEMTCEERGVLSLMILLALGWHTMEDRVAPVAVLSDLLVTVPKEGRWADMGVAARLMIKAAGPIDWATASMEAQRALMPFMRADVARGLTAVQALRGRHG